MPASTVRRLTLQSFYSKLNVQKQQIHCSDYESYLNYIDKINIMALRWKMEFLFPFFSPHITGKLMFFYTIYKIANRAGSDPLPAVPALWHSLLQMTSASLTRPDHEMLSCTGWVLRRTHPECSDKATLGMELWLLRSRGFKNC